MRKLFAETLLNKMRKDSNIVLVTGDLGFGIFDEIRRECPGQFYNCGAAEQAMMGVAVGLAMSGRVPFVYSITPFLLWRAAETIRNYVNYETIPVKLVGSGRGDDYKHDGFSHDATDDWDLMKNFANIISWPQLRAENMEYAIDRVIKEPIPFYLNLKR